MSEFMHLNKKKKEKKTWGTNSILIRLAIEFAPYKIVQSDNK